MLAVHQDEGSVPEAGVANRAFDRFLIGLFLEGLEDGLFGIDEFLLRSCYIDDSFKVVDGDRESLLFKGPLELLVVPEEPVETLPKEINLELRKLLVEENLMKPLFDVLCKSVLAVEDYLRLSIIVFEEIVLFRQAQLGVDLLLDAHNLHPAMLRQVFPHLQIQVKFAALSLKQRLQGLSDFVDCVLIVGIDKQDNIEEFFRALVPVPPLGYFERLMFLDELFQFQVEFRRKLVEYLLMEHQFFVIGDLAIGLFYAQKTELGVHGLEAIKRGVVLKPNEGLNFSVDVFDERDFRPRHFQPILQDLNY